jgi:alkaline phosphatase D
MKKRFRQKLFQSLALRFLIPSLCFALAASPFCFAQAQLPVLHTDHGPNSPAAQRAHYVVLVSLDGFRWDYAQRNHAENLLRLGRDGVWAPTGMLPSYPSLTFPNHLSIVTGLYPEHHGIVANSFLDPTRQTEGRPSTYSIHNAAAVTDGSWYSGVPLWSLAEAQGMRTACLFWPGSEAKIAGERPSEYLRFDDHIDESLRIAQVAEWLHKPAPDRPHFITLYFSDADHAGHKFGPDAPQTHAAIHQLDERVGQLRRAIDATGLPVDLIVVSDHGMAKTEGPWITLSDYADLTGFQTEGSLLYGKTEADRQRVYNQLKDASDKFQVFRLRDLPAELHFNTNARAGDPVIIPTGPYAIRAHRPDAGKPDLPPIAGSHGYDPRRLPAMKASFFAAGPDIAPGKTVAPFENVNLYPWIAHILGLKLQGDQPLSDGKLNILSGALRDNGGSTNSGMMEQMH